MSKALNKSFFNAVEDASILRGIETLSPSSNVFGIIKKYMLNGNTSSVTDIMNRYNSLMVLLKGERSQNKLISREMPLENFNWNLPGSKQHETWLAPKMKIQPESGRKISNKSASKANRFDNTVTLTGSTSTFVQTRSGRKIQRKTYMDCINIS